jgi:hypothetical protein
MTGADRLRREGEALGEVRGQAQGVRRIVVQLLRQRFGALPSAVAARVNKADVVELETWANRVLTANSLDAVLDAKPQRRAPARRPQAAREPARQ